MKILGKFLSTMAFMAILFIIIFIAASALMSTNKDGTFTVGDYSVFNVLTTSMLPEFGEGSIILVKKVYDQNDLKEQDIITFYPQDGNTTVLTHRIIAVSNDGDMRVYQTKGDNNDIPDNFDVTFNRVIGKVVFSADGIGQLMQKIRSPLGIGIVVSVTLLLILIVHLFEDKSKKKKKRRRKSSTNVRDIKGKKGGRRKSSNRGSRSRPAAASRKEAKSDEIFFGTSTRAGHNFNNSAPFGSDSSNAPPNIAMLNGSGQDSPMLNAQMPGYHFDNAQMANFHNQPTLIGGMDNMYDDYNQTGRKIPKKRPETKKPAAKKSRPVQSDSKKRNTNPNVKRAKTKREDTSELPMEIPPY
ncbi:MAG: signal peptidase I [Clostridiales bacterium]|jgi:signal peptidase|nr:signal peptidase I [Clostridiales bacterium]